MQLEHVSVCGSITPLMNLTISSFVCEGCGRGAREGLLMVREVHHTGSADVELQRPHEGSPEVVEKVVHLDD